MPPDTLPLLDLIEECRNAIGGNVDLLCALDREIGDGDHGTNMQRGMQALVQNQHELAAMPTWQAIEEIGMILVSSIGGAAGPLYGTLMIELGRGMKDGGGGQTFRQSYAHAVDAVGRRGRACVGDKTLLDVLAPVRDDLQRDPGLPAIAASAREAAEKTRDLLARRGRASWLGDRSIGHVDPGAQSCALLVEAICICLERGNHDDR